MVCMGNSRQSLVALRHITALRKGGICSWATLSLHEVSSFMLDIWETKILTIEHSNNLRPHHEENYNCQAEQENNHQIQFLYLLLCISFINLLNQLTNTLLNIRNTELTSLAFLSLRSLITGDFISLCMYWFPKNLVLVY